jgi:hypothetical protein
MGMHLLRELTARQDAALAGFRRWFIGEIDAGRAVFPG